MGTTLIVVLAIVALFALFIISIYNTLIALKNRYLNAFAQIEVQLKRRYDLIPNLVETAKAYLKHERETLELVVRARNQAAQILERAKADPSNPSNIQALGNAEHNLAGALGKLNVVVEAYPDLKANENMIKLHEEIASTENRVSFARQAYNDAATSYNTYKQSFPQNIFAGAFGHANDAAFLEFQDKADIQNAPKAAF
ncbi:MAG: LemA family protein [Campylobacteraceae bacterium]|jgi:LemA protein|nr:LemA family protein [Campylobacteraceae bacterium]